MKNTLICIRFYNANEKTQIGMTTRPKVRTTEESPYRLVATLLKRLEEPAQCFEVDPKRQTTLVGRLGTRLTIFPKAFRDAKGNIMDMPVELQLREHFSKKDIFLSNKMTTSRDRLFESAGQLWVAAFYEGRPLDLTYPISVELPVRPGLRNPLNVRLYSGSTASTRSFVPDVSFDWQLSDKKTLPIRRVLEKKYYRFWLYQFNWINCKNTISRRKGRGMISAKAVSLVKKFDDLMAFLVFSNTTSMSRMLQTNDHFTAFNIPSKFGARVLMVGVHQDVIYYGVREIKKTTNCQVFVHMEPVTSSELSKKLDLI